MTAYRYRLESVSGPVRTDRTTGYATMDQAAGAVRWYQDIDEARTCAGVLMSRLGIDLWPVRYDRPPMFGRVSEGARIKGRVGEPKRIGVRDFDRGWCAFTGGVGA